jgi:DNA topoisomerase III
VTDRGILYDHGVELVIAEKPSVARDIARVLGVRGKPAEGDWLENDHYAITWCIGHLVELEEPASYDAAWKPWRLERLPMLPAEFLLRPARHATKQLKTVAKLLRDKRFAAVINACDAGREGELIFRYVYQHAKSRLPTRRLWISSLTDDAIRRGFASLRNGRELDALGDAARSRSEADWLVGMNATRAMTSRNRGAGEDSLLSIGRVQTPTLALLVAREHAIKTFVPKPYWEVRGDFRTESGATFQAPWRHGKLQRLAAAPLADAIVERDRANARGTDPDGPRVVKLRAKTVREPPPQLFDLTSLQRTANRRFGFSAARTLEIAQALYERHKLVTYPRTDSRHLSQDVARELPATFKAMTSWPEYAPFAQQLVEQPPRPTSRIVDDAKVSDHHAIIPTGSSSRGSLDRDEARLFDLIARRFLGAFFPDAEIAVTEAWIRVGPGAGEPPELSAADRETYVDALPPPPDHFLARGRVRMVAGWQEVAGIDAERASKGSSSDRDRDGDRERDDDPTAALPPLVEGQHLGGAFKSVAKETTPPSRFTEASLLTAMETAGKAIDDEALRAAMKDVGLGTPATRAAIIETLLRRKYISREKQQLVPTHTGIGLIAALEAAKVATLASAELTGNWEARLAAIARGADTRAAFMADIARYVTQVIDAIRGGPAPASPPSPAPVPGSPPAARAAPRSSAKVTAAPARKARGTPAPSAPAGESVADLQCPRCKQGTLMQGQRGWGCTRWRDGCRFVIWFQLAGRTITESQLRMLITTGKTRKASFVDAQGRAVDARLVLDPAREPGVRLVGA